jgi:integrase/recombinase XerD
MSNLSERAKMDMALRNFSPKTVKAYQSHLGYFSRYFNCDVEALGEDDIRKYLYHLKEEKKYSNSNLSQAFSAVKFLYKDVLKMPMTLSSLRGPKKIHRLPVVLSYDEVKRIFHVVKNPKHKTILMTTYSAGLRVSETSHLKIADIDSKRMQIRVEQGKGKKDRYTLLSKTLVDVLRDYWKMYRPSLWLFPSSRENKPIDVSTIQRVFKKALKETKIQKPATVHTLRHSFATHLLEQGVGLFKIQKLLGHAYIQTTMIYLHVQQSRSTGIVNPLDIVMKGED